MKHPDCRVKSCTQEKPTGSCRNYSAGHAAGQALGEKLATERLAAMLSSHRATSGDHIASGAHDAGAEGVSR